MTDRATAVVPAVQEYVVSRSTGPDAVQRQLIERTRTLGGAAGMQIASDQGTFMTMVVEMTRPQLVVEVGTFTGYSTLAMARGLPAGGRIIACDVSESWTSIAREHWTAAGVDDRIELRIGPAIETLRALPPDTVVDLAFIDADKTGYAAYYEELLPRIRPGGLLIADNTLWSGRVVDADVTDEDTEAIRAFNDMVVADERVDALLVNIGDGLMLARKR